MTYILIIFLTQLLGKLLKNDELKKYLKLIIRTKVSYYRVS